MYKLLTILLLFGIFASCMSEKKVKTGVSDIQKHKLPEVHSLAVNEFPQKNLLLNDVNFIGYINLKSLAKTDLFTDFIKILADDYFINNLDSFYFTFCDIYKSQEFLFFLKNYNIAYDKMVISQEQIANNILHVVKKTDNQKFGFINFNDSALYGDTALVKELFGIYDKKIEPLADDRYEKFISSEFIKSKADFRIIFMPNQEYMKLLSGFSEKYPLFKPFLLNLDYIFLEAELQKDNIFSVNLIISQNSPVDKLYGYLTNKYKLLLTLNGSPESILIVKGSEFIKTLKIEKINDNKLSIFIKINEKEIRFLSKFLINIIGIK